MKKSFADEKNLFIVKIKCCMCQYWGSIYLATCRWWPACPALYARPSPWPVCQYSGSIYLATCRWWPSIYARPSPWPVCQYWGSMYLTTCRWWPTGTCPALYARPSPWPVCPYSGSIYLATVPVDGDLLVLPYTPDPLPGLCVSTRVPYILGSVGDPNDFIRIRIRIRILLFRPIRIRIRLLSAPNPNTFGFGFGSYMIFFQKI